jgi:hypothetical protein
MQRREPHPQDQEGFDWLPKKRTAADIEAELDAAVVWLATGSAPAGAPGHRVPPVAPDATVAAGLPQ